MAALVVTVGRNQLLTLGFATGWYVGLVDNAGWTGYFVGDTMASHTGWTESVVYSEAVRQTYSPGTAAAGSMDNSASKAVFTINASGAVRGVFLSNSATKSSAGGILYGVGDYAVVRNVLNGHILHVTITLTD